MSAMVTQTQMIQNNGMRECGIYNTLKGTRNICCARNM